MQGSRESGGRHWSLVTGKRRRNLRHVSVELVGFCEQAAKTGREVSSLQGGTKLRWGVLVDDNRGWRTGWVKFSHLTLTLRETQCLS